MVTPVKKTNLADLAFDQIKNDIIHQNPAPGCCIGTESRMCRQLNDSRPIRTGVEAFIETPAQPNTPRGAAPEP